MCGFQCDRLGVLRTARGHEERLSGLCFQPTVSPPCIERRGGAVGSGRCPGFSAGSSHGQAPAAIMRLRPALCVLQLLGCQESPVSTHTLSQGLGAVVKQKQGYGPTGGPPGVE